MINYLKQAHLRPLLTNSDAHLGGKVKRDTVAVRYISFILLLHIKTRRERQNRRFILGSKNTKFLKDVFMKSSENSFETPKECLSCSDRIFTQLETKNFLEKWIFCRKKSHSVENILLKITNIAKGGSLVFGVLFWTSYCRIYVTSTSQHQIFDKKFDQKPESVRIKMADLAGR